MFISWHISCKYGYIDIVLENLIKLIHTLSLSLAPGSHEVSPNCQYLVRVIGILPFSSAVPLIQLGRGSLRQQTLKRLCNIIPQQEMRCSVAW